MSETMNVPDNDDASEAMYQERMNQTKENEKSLVGQAEDILLLKAREERKKSLLAKQLGEERSSLNVSEFNKDVYQKPSEILEQAKNIVRDKAEQDERLEKKLGKYSEFLREMTEDEKKEEEEEPELSKNISPEVVEKNKRMQRERDKKFLEDL